MKKRVFWKQYMATQAQQNLGRERGPQKREVPVLVRRHIPLVKGA